MKKWMVLLCMFAVSANAQLAPEAMPKAMPKSMEDPRFDIKKVKVELLEEETLEPNYHTIASACAQQDNTPIAREGVDLDRIINLGKKFWQIIVDNKPVANVERVTASAVPAGVKCWLDMSNWDRPKSRSYRILYENGFGTDVVVFQFRIVYTAGGQVDGKGEYLTKVSVYPGKVDVVWGYTFNAKVEVPSIVNIGTSKDPVAGMEVHVNWRVETIVKSMEQTESFFIDGLGRFSRLH